MSSDFGHSILYSIDTINRQLLDKWERDQVLEAAIKKELKMARRSYGRRPGVHRYGTRKIEDKRLSVCQKCRKGVFEKQEYVWLGAKGYRHSPGCLE